MLVGQTYIPLILYTLCWLDIPSFLFLPFKTAWLARLVFPGWPVVACLQAAGYDDIVEILEHAEKDAGRVGFHLGFEHGMFFNLLEFASPWIIGRTMEYVKWKWIKNIRVMICFFVPHGLSIRVVATDPASAKPLIHASNEGQLYLSWETPERVTKGFFKKSLGTRKILLNYIIC